MARAAIGERQEAMEDFNQALRLDPELATAYYNRGFIRFELKDYQQAIENFNQAIQLNPENADAYHCRCLVHQVQGDKQEIIADFQKAAHLYLAQGKLEQYKVLVKNITNM